MQDSSELRDGVVHGGRQLELLDDGGAVGDVDLGGAKLSPSSTENASLKILTRQEVARGASSSQAVRSVAVRHEAQRRDALGEEDAEGGAGHLQDLATLYNPYIRGWINYYGSFYRTQLRPTLKRIDLYVIRWARRKFKRLCRKTKGARDWFDRLRRANPTLFAHWQLCHGNGRTSGAV